MKSNKTNVAELQLDAILSIRKIKSAVQSKHLKVKGARKTEIYRLANQIEENLEEMGAWLD